LEIQAGREPLPANAWFKALKCSLNESLTIERMERYSRYSLTVKLEITPIIKSISAGLTSGEGF
jgi:hypothetical protein